MFILVTGGSASGKSEYAENLIKDMNKSNNNSIYIATMQPFGDEAHKRIEKHRKQRADKGFDTIEWYRNLKSIPLEHKVNVLLECMSNLVANEMFSECENDLISQKEKVDSVFSEIEKGVDSVLEKCDNLVIVTNEIFEDTLNYDEITINYIELLGRVNQMLASKADRVIEVVYGITIEHK